MSTILHTHLKRKGWLLADGATGTNLFKLGLETGYPPELWNLEQPEKIQSLHAGFIDAGSDIILTNSFGGNALRLKLHQAEKQVAELNITAAEIARGEADKADRPILVAGSIGPTGELFEPMGALTHHIAEEVFEEQALALKQGGVDLLQIETMSSPQEIEAAVSACRKTGLPVLATMTFDTAGRTMMGITPQEYTQQASQLALEAFGANCGIGPAELLHSVMNFTADTDIPLIIAKGNCGIPQYLDGEIHYHGTPELMAQYAVLARDAGAVIIGGCCGTTPLHVRAMAEALENTEKKSSVDPEMLVHALGKAWGDIPGTPTNNNRRRSRRRLK